MRTSPEMKAEATERPGMAAATVTLGDKLQAEAVSGEGVAVMVMVAMMRS